jgi:hypothetical protein
MYIGIFHFSMLHMHSPLGQRTKQTPHDPGGATGGSSGSAAIADSEQGSTIWLDGVSGF